MWFSRRNAYVYRDLSSCTGKTESEIVFACYDFASAFDSTFHSLRCFELRPTGFSESDPPHMCENLTCMGIEFSYQYILKITKK